ncbi:hypothetical protein P692DRAFT_20408194 [Suillus brevipes Sb2]|nr:hypothetical protein P692DRAFT_20408194 [Suillus brevipes Sb2]
MTASNYTNNSRQRQITGSSGVNSCSSTKSLSRASYDTHSPGGRPGTRRRGLKEVMQGKSGCAS